MATVDLAQRGEEWSIRRLQGAAPYASSDPDTQRIWWSDVGVHQNLTFAVHPDPVSGMHCWHQAVRVRKAEAGDRPGDISVDVEKSQRLPRVAASAAGGALLADGTRGHTGCCAFEAREVWLP
jgi:hypothetical protein